MAKTAQYSADMLQLLLNAVPIANVADNAASSPSTAWYVSLHTADPGETGDQSTSEVTYSPYARVSVARSSGSPAWTVSTGTTTAAATPTAVITFATCTSGTSDATHFGIGSASTGTGKLWYRGPLSTTIAIGTGVVPQLSTTTNITED